MHMDTDHESLFCYESTDVLEEKATTTSPHSEQSLGAKDGDVLSVGDGRRGLLND